MNFCSCHLWENSLSTSRRLPNILSHNVSKYFLLLSQFPGSFNYFWFLNRGKAPEFSNYTETSCQKEVGVKTLWIKSTQKKLSFLSPNFISRSSLLSPHLWKLFLRSTVPAHPWLPWLLWGMMAISTRAGCSVWVRRLLCHLAKLIPLTCSLEKKLQESGRKVRSGLGQCHSSEPSTRTGSTWLHPLLPEMSGLCRSGRAALSPALTHPCVPLPVLLWNQGLPSPSLSHLHRTTLSLGGICFPESRTCWRDAPVRLWLLTDFPFCTLVVCFYGKKKSSFCWWSPLLVVVGSFFPV